MACPTPAYPSRTRASISERHQPMVNRESPDSRASRLVCSCGSWQGGPPLPCPLLPLREERETRDCVARGDQAAQEFFDSLGHIVTGDDRIPQGNAVSIVSGQKEPRRVYFQLIH